MDEGAFFHTKIAACWRMNAGPSESDLVKSVSEKGKTMKREFLEALEVNGAKLPKEVIDSIMDEHGKGVESLKSELADEQKKVESLTTERDGLQTQITDRDNDIAELRKKVGENADLLQEIQDLQTKYDTDTKSLKHQLEEQAYGHATESFFSQYEFASELARKAAMAEFKEQGFKHDEKTGEFLGGKEWLESLKTRDPAAFKVPDQKTGDDDPPPMFSKSKNNEPPKMSLIEMMKLKNENPNAKIIYD